MYSRAQFSLYISLYFVINFKVLQETYVVSFLKHFKSTAVMSKAVFRCLNANAMVNIKGFTCDHCACSFCYNIGSS
jgi:hypothetical protein